MFVPRELIDLHRVSGLEEAVSRPVAQIALDSANTSPYTLVNKNEVILDVQCCDCRENDSDLLRF